MSSSEEQLPSPAAATKPSVTRLVNDAPPSQNIGQREEIEARGELNEEAQAALDYDSSGDETEAYETAYSKLQKIQCKYDATLGTVGDEEADSEVEDGVLTKKGGVPSLPSHKSRRRRAGYGGNKSSLEALSTRSNDVGDDEASPTSDVFNLKDIEDDEFQTDNNLANGLSANDELPAEGTPLQDNSEGNIGNDSDDDDATNPYVAEDEVANMSEDDSSTVPLSDDEQRPRGRTKRTKPTAMKADGDAEEAQDHTKEPQDDGMDEDNEVVMEPAADEVMHEKPPESSERTVQPEPSQDDAATTVQGKLQQGGLEPSDEDILNAVDEIYNGIEDKDLVTVGDVKRPIAKRFGWEKCPKPIGKLIKQRLSDLINGDGDPDEEAIPVKNKNKKKDKSKKEEQVKTNEAEDDLSFEGDLESESETSNGTSSEYEESKPARRSKKGSKSKRREAKLEDNDDGYRTESSIDEPKKKSKRSSRRKRRSSSGKMAKHLRDNASRARERQLEEARIRKEELGHLATDEDKKAVKNEEGHHVSELDKERLQTISARFDTNRDELLIQREEDRAGLIGLLRQRRLQIISSDNDVQVKVESDVKAEVEGAGQPRLTSSTNFVKVEASATRPDPDAKSKTTIDLGSESSSEDDNESASDDDDGDDDLEIIPSAPVGSRNDSNCQSKPPKKYNSTIDAIFSPSNSANAIRQPMNKSNTVANPRMVLRKALKAKQFKAGNRWLARELGYKTEADHIRDCKEAEHKKRQQILLIETEMARRGALRTAAAEANNAQVKEDEELEFDPASSKEDEEMAVAREMGQLEESGLDDEGADGVDEGMYSNDKNNADESADVRPEVPNVPSVDAASLKSVGGDAPDNVVPLSEDVEELAAQAVKEDKSEESTTATPSKMVVTPSHQIGSSPNENATEIESGLESGPVPSEVGGAASTTSERAEADDDDDTAAEQPKSKKKKNSAWKALLEKEKLAAAKQKRLNKKGGTLVDGEAEEEEEEEGIVGLEDFGFAVQKKVDDDDESVPDDDDLGEDDVVDDLSDGEGDEEAGEVARMAAEAREEKERHKEILRRMREGYDGRRGGIASGSARGMLRFDQLVAADNRDDAKRLGLLNDDELDSDDEANGGKTDGPDIEEDEAAMLDKMLKDRFLNKDEHTLEENFSDEESEDEVDQEAKTTEGNEEEEREQDRLAKRFAKRARMNRILEQYEGDSQFSRSRLIDEDESTQHDLKTMKTSLGTKRGIRKENCNGAKKTKIHEDSSVEPASLFTTKEGSLSVALIASRVGRKRKTTFTSGKAEVLSRKNSSSSTRVSVASSHVFVSSESQSQSGFNSSNMSYFKKKRDLPSKSGGSLLSKVMSRSKGIGFRGD